MFVVGVSLFSLALFPLLLLLLESEARRPSRRIWLAVAIVAIWGNLHGAVLAGWGLLACYAILDRARREPWVAAGVLGAATAALFVNPAFTGTVDYYRGVFGNEARRMGVGLWKPLELGGLDVLLIVAAVALLCLMVAAGRRGVRLWEAVAIAGLVVGTIGVARNGTWLLFVAAYPAARGLRLGTPSARVLRIASLVFAGAALALLARSPADPGSHSLATRAARLGGAVLASPVLGQQVQLAGGRVWIDNPIDAFRRPDQRLYLLWIDGKPGGAAAIPHAGHVLVVRDSPPAVWPHTTRGSPWSPTTATAALYRVRPGCRIDGLDACLRRDLHGENHPVIANRDDGHVMGKGTRQPPDGSGRLDGGVRARGARGGARRRPEVAIAGSQERPVVTTTTAAPGSSQGAQGVVQSVGSTSVVVKQLDGSSVTVPVDRRTTQVFVDGKPRQSDRRQAGLRALANLEGREARDAAALLEALGSRHGGGSVLLVEDEENLASLVEAYLVQEGFTRRRGRLGRRRRWRRSTRRAGAARRARPEPAGHGRPRRLPADPRALDRAGRDADRARRGGRPARRPRRRRRRLHRQAVLAARSSSRG